jgi:hypothetical protein
MSRDKNIKLNAATADLLTMILIGALPLRAHRPQLDSMTQQIAKLKAQKAISPS